MYIQCDLTSVLFNLGTPSQKCTRKSLELLISKEKNPGSFSSTIQVFAVSIMQFLLTSIIK